MAGLTPEELAARVEQQKQLDALAVQKAQQLNDITVGSRQQQLLNGLGGLGGGDIGVSVKTGIPLLDAFNTYQATQTAQDPFTMASREIRQVQLPHSDNIWENILGAGAKGLALGGLTQMGENDVQSQFDEDLLPTIQKLYPDITDSLGASPDINATKMALIKALGDESHQNKLAELGVSHPTKGSLLNFGVGGPDDITGALGDGNVDVGSMTQAQLHLKALKDAHGDPVLARQLMKQELASQVALQGLSNSTSVIKNLEALKTKAQTFPGSNSPALDYLAGIGNDLAANFSPGSSSATRNSAVIPIADSLLRALTQVGRGSQYNLQKIIDDLSNAWGKGPEALNARIRNYQEDLLSASQQRAADLVAGGYTGASPALSQIQSLNLDDLGPPNLGSTPQTGGGGSKQAPKYKASDLIAQGYTKGPNGWVAPHG